MYLKRTTVAGLALAGLCLLGAHTPQPRLVMVKVPHWKVTFFHLPEELPVLLQPGESFDPASRVYDFSAGLEAMQVFLAMRPKDRLAPAYARFVKKWPLYQEFFPAVEQEQVERARQTLKKIQAIDPQEPAAHFYSGSLHLQAGALDPAEEDYRRCLAVFPEYGPAYINLARLEMARHHPAQAQTWLQEGLKKMGDGQADVRQMAQAMLQSLHQPSAPGPAGQH